MDLKKWRTATKPLAIDIDGDTLNIRYRPSRLTPAIIQAMQATGQKVRDAIVLSKAAKLSTEEAANTAADDGESLDTGEVLTDPANDATALAVLEIEANVAEVQRLFDSVTDDVVKSVAEWDLVFGGVPIPITREAILEYDIDFPMLSMILKAIQEDQSAPSRPASAKAGKE